jgi:N-acetylglucosaminyl-diphospho-decaprenol L-rhamnosyltransferase
MSGSVFVAEVRAQIVDLLAVFAMENINEKITPEITISVVSHGQIDLIANLLNDIDQHCRATPIELILTLNLEETLPFDVDNYFFQVNVVRNILPKGFSTNHNQALAHATGCYFCVLNPDIRFDKDPFPVLLGVLKDSLVGVVAPLVLDKNGRTEDSARHFPTPFKILCKAFGSCRGSDYVLNDKVVFPDWVAGMFMLFRREVFEKLGGFDERYFLYYEDVDLCARLRLRGYTVALCPDSKVVHHAQRSSHRSVNYMNRHLTSMLRYFFSAPFLKINWFRLTKRMP